MPEVNGTTSQIGNEEGFAYISQPETGEVIQESLVYSQNSEIIKRAKEIVGTAMREVNRGFMETAMDLSQVISNFDIWDIAQDAAPDSWFAYPYYVPPIYRQSQKRGEVIPIYLDENQLRFLRDRSRKLCAENPFAIAAIENRVNYCVGEDGFTIKAVAAPGIELDNEVQRYIDRAQRVLDRWSEYNDIPEVEEWLMSQPDINGDAFVRHFRQKSGLVIHRPVECEHIRSPSGSAYGPHYSFGIQTDPHDVMTVEGYWVIEDPIVDQRPTFVPADEMLHVKRHTPLSAKRGMPIFYSCELLLRSALELLRGVVTTANIRARFAVIRKFTNNVVKEAAQQMVQELQNFSITDPTSGQVLNVEKKPFGSIVNESSNVEHEFPSSNMDAGIYEIAMQMVLRAVACRCNMPEWMFTADASNANYSSSLVAEAPSTKSFGKLQKRLVKVVGINRARGKESLAWIQIKHAVKCGILAPETLKVVALSCEGPTIVVRDKAGEAAMNAQYFDMKAKSRTMVQQEQGWDTDKVKKQLLEEAQFDLELAALQQEGQIKLQLKAQQETGGGQIYQTQLNPGMQMTDQSQPTQGQDQQQPQQPQNTLGSQFKPYMEEGSNGKAPPGHPRLEAVLHEGVTTDVAKALRRAGKYLAKHTNPAPMPGYGQIFSNEGEVWYVGGDGDENGFHKIVEQEIKKAYPGVKKITIEAESFPPRDGSWVQVYPKKKRNVDEGWEDQPRDAKGEWARQSGYSGDLNRISAGYYQYTRRDGKKFIIIRSDNELGKLWHVCEQTGDTVYHHGPPFDASKTIDEAIQYCEGGIKEAQIEEDLIPGGLGDNKPDSDFDPIQLKAGIKVEMEHTNDPKKAKEIAKDHLTEDKDYYKKLKKVEESYSLHEAYGEHKYSSTQFNIKDQCYFTGSNSLNPAVEILKYVMSIPDWDLAKDGREGTPHITIKYGIHTQDFGEVARIVKNFGKVRVKLGKVSVFPANEKQTQRGGDKFDVLKIDVSGNDIYKLNELICKSIEYTDTFPEYHPHITIAYLKPGCGEKYKNARFEGWEIEFDKLCFSSAKGDKTEISLVSDLSQIGDDGHDYINGKAKPQYGELQEAYTGKVLIHRGTADPYYLQFINGKPAPSKEYEKQNINVPRHYYHDVFHQTLSRLTDKLHTTPISNDVKEHRKHEVARALTRLPPTAVHRVSNNIKEVEWFENQAQLIDYMTNYFSGRGDEVSKEGLRVYSKMRDMEEKHNTESSVGGAYSYKNGVLLLSGGYPDNNINNQLFGNRKKIDPYENYLHEFGHAIDGPGLKLSTSRDWRNAWFKEILKNQTLSIYSRKDPVEGFAEFARAIYAYPHYLGPIQEVTPECAAFFMQRGLWPAHLEM